MSGRVGFESWLERDQLVVIDFDSSVVGIASQRFWLRWTVVGDSQGCTRRATSRAAGMGRLR